MRIQKSTLILSVVLVLALVAAGYFYFAWNQSQSQVAKINSQLTAANLNVSSPASIFDEKFHDLLQQHTFLLINTVRRSLDSSASYNASLIALQNNINEVGTLLTPIYGNAGAQQLVDLWNQKTNMFLNYSIAIKNNDSNAQAEFAGNASMYEQQVAQFWIDSTNSNPYPALNSQTMHQLVTTHVNDVKVAVDDWNAKNYPQYFNDLEIAYNQMGVYADVISNGIIQQNPQDF